MTFSENSTVIDVYVSRISRFDDFKSLPDFADSELKRLSNEEVASQKRCAYGLLEYAVKKSFGDSIDLKSLYKDERGKPLCKDFFFSISHTKGLVCVAVSKNNIGVDIEQNKSHVAFDPFKTRILCDSEKIENTEEALALWTKKEAIYKFDDEIEKFIPGRIKTTDYQT